MLNFAWILTIGSVTFVPAVCEICLVSQNLQGTEEKFQVFAFDSSDQLHRSAIATDIKSITEHSEGSIVFATGTGAVELKRDYSLKDSYIFDHSYDKVQVISTPNSHWIHGRIQLTDTTLPNGVVERHHLLELVDPSPRLSVECTTVGVAEFVGHPNVDFHGNEYPQLVIPCWDERNGHTLEVVNLEKDSTKTIEVPFPAKGVLVGTSDSGKQSVVLLSFAPVPVYPCHEGSSILKCFDLRLISKLVYIVEENESEEIEGRIAEEIPAASSYEYISVANFPFNRVHSNGQFLLNNAIYPGRLFLQWTVLGELKNWWYFDQSDRSRDVIKWIDLPNPDSSTGEFSAIAVTRIWGHWCRWSSCGYRIIQLSTNGKYKVIASTPHEINDIVLTSQRALIVSWNRNIYRYDLNVIDQMLPWQESLLPKRLREEISEYINGAPNQSNET